MIKFSGTITSKDISDKLKEKYDIDIDKKKITIEKISTPGIYKAEAKIYENIVATFKVLVKGIVK